MATSSTSSCIKAPQKRFWRAIECRLIFLLLVLLVPVVVLQAYVYRNRLETHRTEALSANLEMARAAARAFETFVQSILNQELSIGLAITSSQKMTSDDINRLLERSRQGNVAIRDFSWVGADGIFLYSTNHALIGGDYSDRSYFRDIANGREWTVGELIVARTTGIPIFVISRGIRDDAGRLLGAVVAAILPDRLGSVLSVERSKGGSITLVDKKGILVFRYPSVELTWEERDRVKKFSEWKDALEGREVTAVVQGSFGGEHRMIANTPIPLIGWAVGAGRSEEAVMRVIYSSLFPQVVLVFLVIVAAFGIALFLSRSISVPIRRLRDHAQALGHGEGALDPVEGAGLAELQDLARAFNVMAEKVQSRESALRESESRYRELVQNANSVIIRWKSDGAITFFNEYAQAFFGYREAEVIDRHVSILLPETESTHEGLGNLVSDIVTYPQRFERNINENVLWDGSRVWMAWTNRPILNTDGQVVEILSIGTDITDRVMAENALRRSETRFRLLSEATATLLTSREPQKVVGELCLRVVEHLDCHAFFNYLADESVGKLHLNAFAGIPEDEAKKIEWLDYGMAACGCVVQQRERFVAEDIFRPSDTCTELARSHGIRTYACHPLMSGDRLIGTLCFGTKAVTQFSDEDLSLMKTISDQVSSAIERTKLIEELQRSRDELERRVRERTVELEQSNQALQEFAYIVSHDLQEPLRTVSSYVQLLAKRYNDKLDEDADVFMGFVLEGAERMRTRIEDLLTYSRVALHGKTSEPVDCELIYKEILSDLHLAIEDAAAVITHDPLPLVEADPTQMRQLFQNLISNAIKFRRDVPLRIHIFAKRSEDEWVFSVQDNGIGIDEQHHERIFKVFQRLHTSVEYPGTGIGLAICRKIVERHGGRIWIESREGVGSTFFFTIPAQSQRSLPRVD